MKKSPRYIVKTERRRGVFIVYDCLKKRALQRLASELAAQNKVDRLNHEHEQEQPALVH